MPNIEELTEYTFGAPNGPEWKIRFGGEPIGTHEPAKVTVTRLTRLQRIKRWMLRQEPTRFFVVSLALLCGLQLSQGRFGWAATMALLALCYVAKDPALRSWLRSWLRRRKAERVYRRWMIDSYTGHAIGENLLGYARYRDTAISSARRASGLPDWEPK